MSLNDSLKELRRFTKQAPLNVVYCSRCGPSRVPVVTTKIYEKYYDWATDLQCTSCSHTWTVCTVCLNSKKELTTDKQRYNHDFRLHRSNTLIRPETVPQPLALPERPTTNVTAAPRNLSSLPQVLALPGRPIIDLNGEHNNHYFKMQHTSGLGNAYLVGHCQFKLNNIAQELDDDEVAMHHTISSLVSTLTAGQKHMLAESFNKATIVVTKRCKAGVASERAWSTQIPTTSSLIRKYYVEGKFAILPNLPRPKVQMLGDHAYVSLRDCVADLLAHGFELDTISKPLPGEAVMKVSQSERAQRILRNAESLHDGTNVLTLYLFEWSDGFEPSSSIKGNRGSCWMKSITISPPENKVHTFCNTYPIALSPDDGNHEEVERAFAKELLSLGSGGNNDFYHGGLKRNVRVHLEMFASLQDQPERRKANYIMLGKSTYTAQWGLALDFSAVAMGIPACRVCLQELLVNDAQSFGASKCSDCVCWDTEASSGLLDFEPPDNYPQDHIPSSGKLSPRRITYDWMMAAVMTAHNGVVSGGWKIATMRAYLRVHGLNEEAVSSIKDCALACKKYSQIKALAGNDKTNPPLVLIEKEKLKHPHLFKMWAFPSTWRRGMELRQHVDVAMHLLFLGVIKTVMQNIHEWMTKREKGAPFLRYSNGIFEAIQSLGISWCRCQPYKSGKLGGWISENYMGAARLFNWFYSEIGSVASDPSFILPDDKPVHRWSKKENTNWLKLRGLNTSGSAKDLSVRVLEYIASTTGPPPILEAPGGSADNVILVVSALSAMIARLMTRVITDIHIIDIKRHIKLFLSFYEQFDMDNRKSTDETPSWITSYNFVCLLNYPSVLKEFGPLRNLWEGGGLGEKILRVVKPSWNGFRKNWQINKMDTVHRKMAMIKLQSKSLNQEQVQRFLDDDDEDDDHNDDDDDDDDDDADSRLDQDQKHMFKIYSSSIEVKNIFHKRHPLSVVKFAGADDYFCIVKKNGMVRLRCDELRCMCSTGAAYHRWALVSDDGQIKYSNITNTIEHYCVLLPKLSKHGLSGSNDEPLYTLITSDWNVIQSDKIISSPKVLGATYD